MDHSAPFATSYVPKESKVRARVCSLPREPREGETRQGRDLCLDTGQWRGRGVRCFTRYLPDRRHRPHLPSNRSRTHRELPRQVLAADPKPEISNYGLPVPRFRDLRLDVLGGGHLGDGSSFLLAFLGPFSGRLGQLGHRG